MIRSGISALELAQGFVAACGHLRGVAGLDDIEVRLGSMVVKSSTLSIAFTMSISEWLVCFAIG